MRRPRLAVRIIRDDAEESNGELEFEVENRSGLTTSLSPEIRCKYYYLSKLQITKGRNRYFVRETERQLAPYTPVVLHATPEHHRDHYPYSWYRTLTFRPARGAKTRVRVRNAHLEPVGFVRFLAEWVPFRLKGKVPLDPHSSLDDMERLRRSQGPH